MGIPIKSKCAESAGSLVLPKYKNSDDRESGSERYGPITLLALESSPFTTLKEKTDLGSIEALTHNRVTHTCF